MLERWLKFNAVGAMGVAVQLAALWLYKSCLEINYLMATALAVETAILHNFAWHRLWTWRGRQASLLRFNFSTGTASIVSNLLFMQLLAGYLGIHYMAANLIAIAATGAANFLLAECFAFRPRSLLPAGLRGQAGARAPDACQARRGFPW